MPTKHPLGWGNGKIIEHEDGTAGYVKSMEFTQAFRVRIADVTGFSVSKGHKMLERKLSLLGNGTLLAAVDVPHGTSEVIENWFREHPLFGTPPPLEPETAITAMVADELTKLAGLRDQGILTVDEFEAQKARLLGP